MISIIMGSDSDLPVMAAAAQTCKEFQIPCEVTVVSAHRTPERMYAFARDARSRGISVIIAGAGGAAHLPGMVAALTTLPVIGVPVRTAFLDGLDSALSILQMPRGVPVATVAVNNSRNAALLAMRILALNDGEVANRLDHFVAAQQDDVRQVVVNIEAHGWESHLDLLNRKRADANA